MIDYINYSIDSKNNVMQNDGKMMANIFLNDINMMSKRNNDWKGKKEKSLLLADSYKRLGEPYYKKYIKEVVDYFTTKL